MLITCLILVCISLLIQSVTLGYIIINRQKKIFPTASSPTTRTPIPKTVYLTQDHEQRLANKMEAETGKPQYQDIW